MVGGEMYLTPFCVSCRYDIYLRIEYFSRIVNIQSRVFLNFMSKSFIIIFKKKGVDEIELLAKCR